MTHRHHPRTCGSCALPMAGQRNDCWSCGTAWEAVPEAPLVPATAAVEPELLS